MSRPLRSAWLPWLALLASALLLSLAPLLENRYLIFVLYFFCLSVALAQSWNLIGGYTGLISLGHAAFFGLGAYAAAMCVVRFSLPLWLGIVFGGVLAATFGFLISFITFRFRGVYFTIGTLVLAEALRLWMVNWEYTGGAHGLQFPFEVTLTPGQYYELMLALAAGSTAALMLVLRSKLGIGLRAIRDNEEAARTMGVDIFRTKLSAFLISAFLAGLVGAVHAAKLGSIEPYSIFSASWSISATNIVIIGGVGTVLGPLLGSVFNSASSELLSSFSSIHLILEGLLVIVIIRFLPGGLVGLLARLGGLLDPRSGPRRRATPKVPPLEAGPIKAEQERL